MTRRSALPGTRADDTASDGSCTRRDYTFDKNTNRTALANATGAVGAACSSTDATTTTSTYDSADRLTTTGALYDAFGRTTTQASGTTIGYYANDQVRRQTMAGKRQTWTLDAAGRLAAWTTESQGTDGTWTQTGSKVNHYGDDSDSPDWTAEDAAGTVTRAVQGSDGNLVALTTATGNPHPPAHRSARRRRVRQPRRVHHGSAVRLARCRRTIGRHRHRLRTHGRPPVRHIDRSVPLSGDPEYGGSYDAYEYCHGDSADCADVSGGYGANRWGCGATVDRPHKSHTNPHAVNVHADLKCKAKVPRYSIHIALYRSRRYGWEQVDTGYVSGTNKYKARAVANWAPHGTCYCYLAVGDFHDRRRQHEKHLHRVQLRHPLPQRRV
ncbi:hypothetical protein [Streptomyces sp.]|uniref:hypothetical protein n=1 Tax=Streptomyces sp. TaxID=1931 RepID=UPI0025D43FBC|nr:hypothetical protein [Streptomyces sp.]